MSFYVCHQNVITNDILEGMTLAEDTHLAVEVRDNLRHLLQRVAELKTWQKALNNKLHSDPPSELPETSS